MIFIKYSPPQNADPRGVSACQVLLTEFYGGLTQKKSLGQIDRAVLALCCFEFMSFFCVFFRHCFRLFKMFLSKKTTD